MAGISKLILVGNLGQDPETRYTPNGTMNVRFSIAVNRRFRDSSGQDQERTTWFRVTAWGKLAETADRLSQSGYLTKGKQVYVEGRLESSEYKDQQGETRFSLDVYAMELQLLGNRGDSDGGQFGGQGGGGPRGGSRGSDAGDAGDSQDNYDEVPF